MQKIITGGCGFIGSEFIRHLDSKSIVIDKLTYAGEEVRIPKLHTFYKKDISIYWGLKDIFESQEIDVVVNFAAETHVDNSIEDVSPFIQTNIVGVKVLCDLCLQHDLTLIHISTDEVYGESHSGYFTEDSPLKPNNPYSATKASAELLIRAYIRTYGLKCIIVRPSNNYGHYQHKEKFLPVIIQNALSNKSIPVYGEGKQIREWTHVSDTCRAINLIIEKGIPGEAYNIGSGFECDNLTTVRTVLRTMDKPKSLIKFVPDRPGHDFRYSINSDKIKSLGWEPKVDFLDGIKQTIEFYSKK